MQNNCPCGSGNVLAKCCGPYINGKQPAPSAEALMRSRYTAYTLQNADYIYNTTHPAERRNHNKKHIMEWAKSCHWVKLEILRSAENVVEFKACYLASGLQPQVHHERSFFEKVNEVWYYKSGIFP